MTREIPLTKGFVALVDDEDFDRLMNHSWCIQGSKSRYAACRIAQKYVYMHRFVLDAPAHLQVDHIDMNGLNNTRDNLRLVIPTHNMWNRTVYTASLSRFKGVTRDKRKGLWFARISANKKTYWLGYFADEVDAAHAYDDACRLYHGTFGRCNFPQEPTQ